MQDLRKCCAGQKKEGENLMAESEDKSREHICERCGEQSADEIVDGVELCHPCMGELREEKERDDQAYLETTGRQVRP